MSNVITVTFCHKCNRNMQVDVVKYHQTDLIFGQVLKYECITYLCTGCGEKIVTEDGQSPLNIFNANQTSAKVEYQKKLKKLLDD